MCLRFRSSRSNAVHHNRSFIHVAKVAGRIFEARLVLQKAVDIPSAPTASSLHRRKAGGYLASLLVIVATAAAASQPQIPGLPAPADQEPISSVPPAPVANPVQLALGERLFADPRLSRDGSRTCSSCHDVGTNGADGNRHDRALDGSDLPFNTTTVFNAALSFRLGWEGGFPTLEAQVEALLENSGPMGTTVAEIVGKLSADPKMTRQFGEAYGHGPDRASLVDALATYERSLLTPGSRFDQWLDGDAAALSIGADWLSGVQIARLRLLSSGC